MSIYVDAALGFIHAGDFAHDHGRVPLPAQDSAIGELIGDGDSTDVATW